MAAGIIGDLLEMVFSLAIVITGKPALCNSGINPVMGARQEF